MKKLTIVVFLSFLYLANIGFGYDDERTHRKLTERAVDLSSLSSYLKNNLGFREGSSLIINGRTISWWLSEGAYLEDHPICRASNHFHNPLDP
ncbi:MAG: hypothetical protein HXY46_13245 [Syntrophaceae bacterium]|nr:hypothetical protein [Syntrophaceae bacterium]